jgi:hypothetical protein
MYNFFSKMGWATFWAIFSQSHLVALDQSRRKGGSTGKAERGNRPKKRETFFFSN